MTNRPAKSGYTAKVLAYCAEQPRTRADIRTQFDLTDQQFDKLRKRCLTAPPNARPLLYSPKHNANTVWPLHIDAIVQLRRQTDWSFERIGRRLGLKGRGCYDAYLRYVVQPQKEAAE